MFGYVTINRGELKVRELETYESYYCGLCRVLKDRYGLAGCTMLNYDMTFLGMLLSSLYEEKEEPAKRVCRPGFKRPLLKKKSKKQFSQTAVVTESLGYAADMNYMLAYHNHMDNWLDEHSFASLNMVHLMQKNYRKLAKKYPRQHKAIASYIQEIPPDPSKYDTEVLVLRTLRASLEVLLASFAPKSLPTSRSADPEYSSQQHNLPYT